MTHDEYESKSQAKRVEILKAEEKQMTHEELLQKLADIAHNKDAHEARNDYLLALLAVVKLHKPKTPTLPTIIEWDTKTFTNHFIYEDKCAIDGKSYPCPTIQAIKKELQ